jgi:hypothetical protein
VKTNGAKGKLGEIFFVKTMGKCDVRDIKAQLIMLNSV